MGTRHQPAPDVAARFPDLDRARAAIEALENSGVDGDDIKLLGPAAQQAATEPTKTAADSRAVTHVFWRVTRASVIWGAVGVLVGLAVGALVLWAFGSWDTPAWLLVFAILGAFLMSTVGAMIGAERSISDSDAWTATFQNVGDGAVWVAVRAREPGVVERARRTLERAEPVDLRVARAEP